MRAKPVAAEEQYQLIMECRASGLTDYQWCLEHDIKPGTFYNWVKRLRQKGCAAVPSKGKRKEPVRQDVVKLDLQRPSVPITETEMISEPELYPVPAPEGFPVVELSIAGAVVRIPQRIDPVFLGQLVRILRDELC